MSGVDGKEIWVAVSGVDGKGWEVSFGGEMGCVSGEVGSIGMVVGGRVGVFG